MQPVTEVLPTEPTLISKTHYCVVGDVTIDASCAIAPGVVLQASSGSRVVIGKGVCIAAGVCVQSRAGVLTIASGVSLGANVLVIGKGMIGANACVSPGSTLIDPAVEAEAILPPATLIGASPTASRTASSHQAAASYSNQSASSAPNKDFQSNGYIYNKPSQNTASPSPQPEPFKNTFVAPGPVTAKPVSIPDLSDQSSSFVPPPPINQPFNQPDSSTNNVQSGYGSSSLTVPSNNEVYGKSQVNQLISALFPNRQSLNNNS